MIMPNLVMIMPKLGTSPSNIPVGDALFGKTRQAVLAALFRSPGKGLHVNEIIRAAGGATGQVQRELDRMLRTGLLSRERIGNQFQYKANPQSAIFDELVGIVTKTFGIADVLRKSLDRWADRIDVAVVYGSVAKGQHHATSDVDVLIVGDILLSDLDPSLSAAETALGRTVSPTMMDERSYRKRIATKDHFLKSVIAGPKIFLIGDAARLKALGERRTR
jgi:predicted nucleotidyltransferase